MDRVEGKVALLTGIALGIWARFYQFAGKRAAKVVGSNYTLDGAKKVVEQIKVSKGKASAIF